MNDRWAPRLLAFGSSATLHLVTVAAAAWMSAVAGNPPPAAVQERATPNITFFVEAQEDERFPGLNPVYTENDWDLEPVRSPRTLTLDAFSTDLRKIAEHRDVVFPFVSPGLALENFALTLRPQPKKPLVNPLDQSQAGTNGASDRALTLDEMQIQALVDRTWSRTARWQAFTPLLALTRSSDPDGVLARALDGYLRQNWLQPYADASARDPRLWAELGLAADHVDFIGFIRQYVSDHPATKSAIELLFLLDKIAQASHNTLATLLNTDIEKDLTRTRTVSPEAYRLVTAIRQHVTRALAARGLTSDQALTRYFNQIRLRILGGIVQTAPHGFRAADARYLIGAIYWTEGRRRDALASWRHLTPDPEDAYAAAYAEVLSVLRQATPAPNGFEIDAATARQIDRILEADRRRWLVASIDRLHHFGYRSDTF